MTNTWNAEIWKKNSYLLHKTRIGTNYASYVRKYFKIQSHM